MPTMPALGSKCVTQFNESLKVAATTEALWLMAPPTSEVRKQLRAEQLEALYEATYLRLFATYEAFVEDVLVHFMAGYVTPSYTPQPANGQVLEKTLTSARLKLYGTNQYLLWHNPSVVLKRARRFLVSSPVEVVLDSRHNMLEHYAAVRHHIAHNSRDSRLKFGMAATQIAGSDFRGKPGKFLRATDISDPLNSPRWIRRLVDELSATVSSICL